MIFRSLHKRISALAICICLFFNAQSRAQDDDEKVEIPPPVNKTLVTKDKVNLACTFFGGTMGKETVPIILLHDIDGRKEQYYPVAQYLQKAYGHAVIVPDLRGHGASTQTESGDNIDRTKFRKAEFASMSEDIATCFRFLRDEVNNKGEANIDMLCVVAAGYVSINAMEWTLADYAYKPLDGKKQGQFVKGLILLSPRKSNVGYNMNQMLRVPLFSGRGLPSALPMLIASSDDDDKSMRDAKSIYNTLKRTRPKVTEQDATERFKQQTLFLGEYKKGVGAGLLDPRNKTKLEVFIARFIQYKIQEHKDKLPWVNYEE